MPDDSREPSASDDLGGLNPEELFAQALPTAKMQPTSDGGRGWTPPTIEELQRVLPLYEILEVLGLGGMGAVYKGMQRSLDRHVAIKILPPGLEDADVHYAERFKVEAKSMARLSHPGIVAVFDAGETADGLLYFVMEFIEGTDVQKMIATGPLEAEQALAITANVCDALGFAHESGIVHRDIKPANIMIDARGRVKVADFGLAKVTTLDSGGFTRTNLTMGTPDYIAPEALTSIAHVDGRADLYAVGVMLYTMLTGSIPRGRFALPSGVVKKLDPRFDAIVDKAMQTDREQRYPSAAAMRADLDCILSGPIPVALPAPRRSKMPLLIAAAVVVLGVGGWSVWKSTHTNAPGPLAAQQTQPALEPGARKLWETAEQLPNTPGIRWENGAARLDGTPLRYSGTPSRDAILRADIRMNPEHSAPQIALRYRATQPGGDSYFVAVDAGKAKAKLTSLHLGKQTELKSWPLPRVYGPDEWLRLELRAIGDELTVSADGQTLGTVRDTSHPEAGDIQLFAVADGYFRNIVYVPLDKGAAVSPSPSLSVSPSAIAATLAANPANWVDRLTTGKWEAPWTLENGVLKTTDKAKAMSGTVATMQDGAIRVRARAKESTGIQLQLVLRSGIVVGVEHTTGKYQLQTNLNGKACSLIYFEHRNGISQPPENLWSSPPVPAALKAKTETEWEFRVVGDEFTAWADGQLVATVHDKRIPKGAAAFTSDVNLEITKVETIDFASGAPFSSLPVSPSANAATLAANPANWVDRLTIGKWADLMKAGKWPGSLVLENGVLKATAKDKASSGTLATMQDGALRLRVRATGSTDRQLQLSLRQGTVPGKQNSTGGYTLVTLGNGLACTLNYSERLNGVDKSEPLWSKMALPAALIGKKELEWELRAVGDEFSVWADGQLIGTAHDSRVPTGGANFTTDTGLEITKAETIDFASLSASPSLPASADAALRVASGELSRSARLPVSPSSPSASYPKPAAWIDATNEVGVKMGDVKAGVLDEGQLRMTKGASIPVAGGREFHNAVVRITCTHNASIFLRQRDRARYNAMAGSKGGGFIDFNDPAQNANTNVKRENGIPPANFDPEAEHEIVFAVQDDRFTLWVDGVEKTTLRDSTLARGSIGVQVNTADGITGTVRIRKIEYAELPDVPPVK